MTRPYHHGDLRRSLLDAAIDELTETPPSSLSLRALARRVGVSHAAPAHHFGDRAGLLEAIAREGFEALGAALTARREEGGTFLDIGVAYVLWALENPVHHRLMYGPDVDRERLKDVRARTRALLREPALEMSGDPDTALAGWSIAHGLAVLLIDEQIDDARSAEELATAVLGRLGRAHPSAS